MPCFTFNRRNGNASSKGKVFACFIFFISLFFCRAHQVQAQSTLVRGFVTDSADGESLQGVNVVLDNGEGGFYGTVTDNDGVYALSRVPPGRYVFRVSYIGYKIHKDTLLLRSGTIVSLDVELRPRDTQLGEVMIEAEQPSGAARITAGLQSVRPQDIELVPAPDVSGDLATYLTTLPGVVAIGDRGGQLFVRGGEPSHNMALIDGMYVHQPFHILGFYSAFPADIINRADVYAGGFGSQFNGRISSVIDVYTRNGNKKRYGGNASIAPFVSAAIFEGPIAIGKTSILGSIRQSVIKQGAQNYISEDLPYRFGDAFAKLHTYISDNSQLSFSFINTHDSGVLGEPTVDRVLDEIRWKNTAFGVRYLFLSGSKPFLGELLFSVSKMRSEVGPSSSPIRSSEFNSFNYAVNFTNFIGRTEWKYGIFTRAPALETELGGLYQDLELGWGKRHKIGLYLEPDVHINAQLRARIGVVAMMFTGNTTNRIFEPRARIVWEKGAHELSAAAGRYHQEVIGLTDRRDATNIFTAWVSAPSDKLTDATHVIAGYRFHPTPWIEFGTEVFYKKFDNVFIAEWTSFPRFTTRMQRASGRAMGWDLRVEVRRPNLYGYLNYGLSSVEYKARQATLPLWYGTDKLKLVSPDPLDATVSIVDLVNSNRYVLQDSVIQLPNGDYRHIYWSEFDVAHFDIYRLEVERFDGQLTKSSQIQVPGPISLTVALNNTTVLSDLIQTIIIEGNPPATPRIDVRYDAFTVTPAGTRLQDNPVTLSYANKTSAFNDTLRLGIDLQADFRTISEDFDAKDIVGLICIDKIVVDVHVGNKEWKSPTGVFDPDFLVEPGTFTNIENGFGFFGAGFVETLSFLPDEISLIRAGFFDCDG